MRHLSLIFLFLSQAFLLPAQNLDSLRVEQPLINDLFLWGDQIIAEVDRDKNDKYYYVDSLSNKIKKLKLQDNFQIIHLTESKSFLFAIVKNQDHFQILWKEKKKDLWFNQEVPQEFNSMNDSKFVATDSLLVLVTPKDIYYKLLNSTWQTIAREKLINQSFAFSKSVPEHCLLSDHSLYLGYDRGEWGGMLIEIPFLISSYVTFKKGKSVLKDNIIAMSYSKDSILWIATGLAHLGLRESGIYKYQHNKLQKVLWSTPNLSLKNESDLSAFCLNNDGEPFFVATELGVFKIVHDSLPQIIKEKLYTTYSMKNYIIGSLPVAMYVDNENNIFIASRSLGIFKYRKYMGQYKFSQIIFD